MKNPAAQYRRAHRALQKAKMHTGSKTGGQIQGLPYSIGVRWSSVTRGASEEPASILGAVIDSITTKSFWGGV